MGGCCSSSRKLQLRGSPVYYYYPPVPEEHAFLNSHDSGLLLDLNLNMSVPDTYRPPPAPIPYDMVLGCPQSTDVGSREVTLSGNCLGKRSRMGLEGTNYTTQFSILPPSPKKSGVELLKSSPLTTAATDEEDVCPTCLEDYDSDNPKIMTKCNHHFHLSCILEWMERSDTCPICDQVIQQFDFFLSSATLSHKHKVMYSHWYQVVYIGKLCDHNLGVLILDN